MKCKKCDKEFHYCTSCSPDESNDRGYCCESCYRSSDEFIRYKIEFMNLLKNCTSEMVIFWALENWVESDEHYYKEWLTEFVNKET